MLKGNKGEWSEIYALMRLLDEGKIYAADDELNKLNDIYFPIKKIIREETKEKAVEYYPGESVKIFYNDKEMMSIPPKRFREEADYLLNIITEKKNRRSFEIGKTESFMNEIHCYKISAPSSSKADICMQIIDVNTGYSPTVGFSIKSELGNPPTLLNAGKTTNFTYEVVNPVSCLIKETNVIYGYSGGKAHTDVRGRIENIINKGSELKYCDTDNQTFKDNMILIDSCMDKIIAETLLYFYRDGITYCSDMVERLKKENPLHYGNVNAYEYKFKKFLSAVALGMRPASEWNGLDEANGGYIIITKQGKVLAYHIYNRNYFEKYLLNNTKYETASTSRHGFGEMYLKGTKEYIKLNLQIRFIK